MHPPFATMLSLLVAASRMPLTVGTRPATSCTPERMFRSFPFSFSSSVAGVVHVCTPAQPSTLSGGCVAWNLFAGALVTAQYSPSTRRSGEPSSRWLASQLLVHAN